MQAKLSIWASILYIAARGPIKRNDVAKTEIQWENVLGGDLEYNHDKTLWGVYFIIELARGDRIGNIWIWDRSVPEIPRLFGLWTVQEFGLLGLQAIWTVRNHGF